MILTSIPDKQLNLFTVSKMAALASLAAALSETGMTGLQTNMMRQMISNFPI
jgi:hypothetical protein